MLCMYIFFNWNLTKIWTSLWSLWKKTEVDYKSACKSVSNKGVLHKSPKPSSKSEPQVCPTSLSCETVLQQPLTDWVPLLYRSIFIGCFTRVSSKNIKHDCLQEDPTCQNHCSQTHFSSAHSDQLLIQPSSHSARTTQPVPRVKNLTAGFPMNSPTEAPHVSSISSP